MEPNIRNKAQGTILKLKLSALMQNIYAVSGGNLQNMKISNLLEFLRITLELDNTIKGKKDKEYAKLIDRVIQEIEYNISVI